MHVAGDRANAERPDTWSPFLGWEWSRCRGARPSDHYGHKNVVFLRHGGRRDSDPADRRHPTPGFSLEGGPFPPGATTALAVLNGERGRDLARFVADAVDTPRCPAGVPVRELPDDCREYAATPEELFSQARRLEARLAGHPARDELGHLHARRLELGQAAAGTRSDPPAPAGDLLRPRQLGGVSQLGAGERGCRGSACAARRPAPITFPRVTGPAS